MGFNVNEFKDNTKGDVSSVALFQIEWPEPYQRLSFLTVKAKWPLLVSFIHDSVVLHIIEDDDTNVLGMLKDLPDIQLTHVLYRADGSERMRSTLSLELIGIEILTDWADPDAILTYEVSFAVQNWASGE